MDSRTGELYPSLKEALAAGVPKEAAVELRGDQEAVERISRAVKAQHQPNRKARRKAARASRKKNRG